MSAERIVDFLSAYTAEPHPAGTHENYLLAKFTESKFREFGIEHVDVVKVGRERDAAWLLRAAGGR